MRTPLPFAPLLALFLVACQPAQSPDSAAPASEPQASAVIRGRALYLERIAPPPGAVLHVQLIDNRLADTPKAVIAEQAFEGLSGPPYEFELAYAPAQIAGDGSYGLHASLSDAEGKLRFVTDTRVPVTPGSADAVEFRMVRVAEGDDAGSAMPTTQTWQCGDQRIATHFADDTLTLSVDGRQLSLPRATSASGARFDDGVGTEFWSKGERATLIIEGEKLPECVAVAAPSPWDEAKARGIGFRAVGQEPGWMVEVGVGEAPMIRASVDYGQRQFQLPSSQPLEGGGYRGKVAGVTIELRIKREPCQDTMSGEAFPASAELQLDEQIYRGCGRFLVD